MPAINHKRPDAGEALKDMKTKGRHSRGFERKENFVTPEFAMKKAALPSWLLSYVKALKGSGIGPAGSRMATARGMAELAPESAKLKDMVARTSDVYRGEVAKTTAAYGAPALAAALIYKLTGKDKAQEA